MLLTKEKSLSNPETWSDEKLVKVAKKDELRLRRKSKFLSQTYENHTRKNENEYRVHEQRCQQKVLIVEKEVE